jgi:hypothetical protein
MWKPFLSEELHKNRQQFAQAVTLVKLLFSIVMMPSTLTSAILKSNLALVPPHSLKIEGSSDEKNIPFYSEKSFQIVI